MDKIQMVDLISQYSEIKAEVDAGIMKVLAEGSFINGPAVANFTTELSNYLNGVDVIPCANGTDALQIAMMALGLKPGDEVIVPVFTYVATAEVIALLGLTPVFVDVNPQTFNIETETLKSRIGPKTRAIVPVHLFGQCADMEPILNIAAQHNLHVIEDTAQALGAEYTFSNGKKAFAGTMGTIGTTSFFPSKNLGCFGDGGAIFTHDPALAARMRKIANHGQGRLYYHDEVGVNSRLDSIQAAVLSVKLKHLKRYTASRQNAANAYDKAFKALGQVQTPYRDPKSTHVFHQYTLKVPASLREGLENHLNAAGIPNKVYYPVPLHKQEAYILTARTADHYPNTEALCQSVISLPMHSELSSQQLELITQKLIGYFNKQE
jgi:UDP-2-acetamido-2-deoxy-ribo-hexuluronate aminotransferase